MVHFNRDKIALFGANIEDINRTIKTAFAGESAGFVYEGEKRFDVVLRLQKDQRSTIEHLRNLYVSVPNGKQVPLSQLAEVEFKVSPNQIQRDDTKRRITIGFNVKGRDVESIVNEMQQKVNDNISFSAGYYPTYGGTFKNLIEARERLMIAVPVALLLIFVLLFFTFKSLKQSLLIFTAIPLSAIGGVFALFLRDMPFSISAGVGFIALFGVAVLNGIVLISEFNHLKSEGMSNTNDIILHGTAARLRPVLMTALVASLGFLPMALSQGSGAEDQVCSARKQDTHQHSQHECGHGCSPCTASLPVTCSAASLRRSRYATAMPTTTSMTPRSNSCGVPILILSLPR